MGEPATTRDLLELLDRLSPTIAELTQTIEQEAEKVSRGAAAKNASRSRRIDRIGLRADHRSGRSVSSAASRSRAIWDWSRWEIPAAIDDAWDISLSRGVSILRFLLVEAAQVTVRACRSGAVSILHLMMRRGA